MSPSIFRDTTYGCALGKKCRRFRVHKVCGLKAYNRHSLGRHDCATGTACHERRSLTLLDTPGAADTLPHTTLVAGVSTHSSPANREHRCESGTAPPL